jgi:hypothetical protein
LLRRQKNGEAFYIIDVRPACGCIQNNENEFHVATPDSSGYVDHCIGRYQFSLSPVFAQAAGGVGEFHPESMPSEDPSINLEFVASGIDNVAFKNMVEARIAELRAEKKGSGVDYLADVRKLTGDSVEIRVGNADKFYRSELHALKGTTYVVGSLESSDNLYKIAVSNLRKFIEGVVITGSPGDAGKGFCIGPLTINGKFNRNGINSVI